MISVKSIVGNLVTAAITGAVGFASASYLQSQSSKEEIARIERVHALAIEEAEAERERALVDRREERAFALYGQWNSEPLRTSRRVAREVFTERPLLSYSQEEDWAGIAPERKIALGDVLLFWTSVDDFINAKAIDEEQARTLLGADAAGWHMLLMGMLTRAGCENFDPRDGHVLYSARATYRLSGASTHNGASGEADCLRLSHEYSARLTPGPRPRPAARDSNPFSDPG